MLSISFEFGSCVGSKSL